MANIDRPERIGSLDTLRAIAIFLVIGFHYYARWTPPVEPTNYYPYGSLVADWWILKFGFYGVPLFFIISGFVIALTLEKCRTMREFIVRRFARLWPPILLCSVISFFGCKILSGPLDANWRDFIPSLTFIGPEIFNIIIKKISFSYVDGAYWSLFVEARFYFWAMILFFGFREKFLAAFFVLFGFSALLDILTIYLHMGTVNNLTGLVFIGNYLAWFAIGAGFYFRRHPHLKKLSTLLIFCAIAAADVRGFMTNRMEVIPISALLVLLVWLALENRWVKSALSTGLLPEIGLASYSLYLLHQNLGIDIISQLGKLFPAAGMVSLVFPVLVALFFAAAAHFIYRFYEHPINRWIVKNYSMADQTGNRH